MSTILLPSLRKARHNLYRFGAAGTITATNVTPNFGSGTAVPADARVKLTDVGLKAGDVISASAEILNTGAELGTLGVQAEDAVNTPLSQSLGTFANNTFFNRHFVQGFTIPAGTDELLIFAIKQSPSANNIWIRNGSLNRGSTAAAFEHAKRGATAPLAQIAFGMDGSQVALPTNAGVTQITSFPSRLWMLRFTTIPFEVTSDEFREWELAVNQLSDITNVFRFVPPDYRGPSTGYADFNPQVNGAGQLGTSLNCDSLSNNIQLLKAGDFVSFDVTSPKGNTNVQLCKLAADAMSNGSGQVTLTFTKPIRQAPADNAVVQIFSPTAQFRFVQARHETSSDSDDFASFSIDAIEQVYP